MTNGVRYTIGGVFLHIALANCQSATITAVAGTGTLWIGSTSTVTITQEYIGPFTEFNPPSECFTNTKAKCSPNTDINEPIDPYKKGTPYATLINCQIGCGVPGQESCCPPNWKASGYYNRAADQTASLQCPQGYTTVSSWNGQVGASQSGGSSADPCCPRFTYSYPSGYGASTTGTLLAKFSATYAQQPGDSSSAWVPQCYYSVANSITTNGTDLFEVRGFWAPPIYIFDETNGQTFGPNVEPTTTGTMIDFSPSTRIDAGPTATGNMTIRPSQSQTNVPSGAAVVASVDISALALVTVIVATYLLF